jgi:phosphoglycolate phosphatase-like HAD superfamily hydrolase
MTKVLFWDFDGSLARRAPDWRLAEGALDTLETLSAKGWRHVVIDDTEGLETLCAELGLAAHLETIVGGVVKSDPAYLKRALERVAPYEEAFVIGDGVATDIAAARAALLPSILVGDASPLAQFCVETLAEIPLALETWATMRRALLS